jgi:hypothetical protein
MARKGNNPDLGRIHSLTQGVSQQPEHLRREGTVAEQINGWSSPVEGVRKRMPSKVVARLSTAAATACWSERIVVAAGQRFAVVILVQGSETFLSIWNTATWTRVPVVARGTVLQSATAALHQTVGHGLSGSRTRT